MNGAQPHDSQKGRGAAPSAANARRLTGLDPSVVYQMVAPGVPDHMDANTTVVCGPFCGGKNVTSPT